jgi:phosphatidylglycerol:prolipoprotein diacylglycerol transferase
MELVWDIYPVFEVFGLKLRWYSLIYSVTLVLGWLMVVWQVERGGGTEKDANWLVAWCIFAVFMGGRLGHLFFYDFERLAADPGILFRFREGGIASHGSTFALLLVLWAFARAKHQAFLEVCDRISHAVALAASTVRVGNLFNSEVVGRLTDQTWGMRFPYHDHTHAAAPLRHPSQLYEFALGAVILLVITIADWRLGEDRPRGLLASLFWSLYFTGRFVVEFFKEYQSLPEGSVLTMGQILSIPLALGGWLSLWWILRRNQKAGWRPAESG